MGSFRGSLHPSRLWDRWLWCILWGYFLCISPTNLLRDFFDSFNDRAHREPGLSAIRCTDMLGRAWSFSFLFLHLRNFRSKYPNINVTNPMTMERRKKVPSLLPVENFGSNLKPIFVQLKKPHNESDKPTSMRTRSKMYRKIFFIPCLTMSSHAAKRSAWNEVLAVFFEFR